MLNPVVKTFGVVGFTAFVLPGILAPAASAQVFSIEVGGRDNTDCVVTVGNCYISVMLKGADRAAPVTVKVNGILMPECVPTSVGKDWTMCNVSWSPEADGTYVISATQGTRTKSVTLNIPGQYGQGATTGSADPLTWLGDVLTGSAG